MDCTKKHTLKVARTFFTLNVSRGGTAKDLKKAVDQLPDNAKCQDIDLEQNSATFEFEEEDLLDDSRSGDAAQSKEPQP